MRIGELATKTGVSTRALRYYEEQRLLTSERSPSGQRTYPEAAVVRVGLIQQLYSAGLASKSILQLMPCVVTGEASPELLVRLAAERERIEGQIRDLIATRDRLDEVITSATASVAKPCDPM
ncbi:MerR family transcriptional regulator [Streptomyces sp. NBC_01476]|uniref:MerR family transcriptional regulator n=1 Tax=Streptomyces sp. NBC_01476 TaxID=2903881 RepID=UPI002E2F01F9|nr:MerR family transcriptional regulator [Streptomyces sp. NBC_01476]